MHKRIIIAHLDITFPLYKVENEGLFLSSCIYHYSGKFSWDNIFADFAVGLTSVKIKPRIRRSHCSMM